MRSVLVLLPLAACAPAGPDPEVLAAVADGVGAELSAFETRADALAQAAVALCDAPSEATLADAQAAWRATRGPWKRVEVAKFGPFTETPWRFGPLLDFWPVRADAVETYVAGDGPVDAEAFGALAAATRGLPVVEWLLWGGAPLTDLQDARRCAFLVGASADVAANATALGAAWDDPWRARLVDPVADDDAYDTRQDVVDEWVNRLAFTVENIRSTKFGKPLGDASGGELQPDALESRPSGHAAADAFATLQGVRGVALGRDGGLGVVDLLPEAQDDVADRVVAWFDAADVALGGVTDPLETTLVVEPEVVEHAQDELLELQSAIQVDLAQALSVTITFNDNDGD